MEDDLEGSVCMESFDNQIPAALKKLPFDHHLSLHNVRKVISEAGGYQPHLIAPEQEYRRLINGALGYFKGPAEASIDAVHFILKELVRKSLNETQKLKRRIFPRSICSQHFLRMDILQFNYNLVTKICRALLWTNIIFHTFGQIIPT